MASEQSISGSGGGAPADAGGANSLLGRLSRWAGAAYSAAFAANADGYEEMSGGSGEPCTSAGGVQCDFHRRAAAIYLRQGVCNEKFDRHPVGACGTAAYVALHSAAHYCLELVVSAALLALALLEEPASLRLAGGAQMLWMHLAGELCCLAVIAGQVVLKVRWLGTKKYLKHWLSAIKTAVLLVMLAEACIVTVRQTSHVRLTRCLRPVFLLDSHYCYNVRRFTRQLLHAVPPVLDMLVLLFTFIWLFSILGYFFFNETSPEYFGDPGNSFVSLFILLTTANNPDVTMGAFSASRANCLFFIVYLCIMLYFLMNMLLAVVYEDFSSHERTKYGKLLAHRMEGARRAYELLKAPAKTVLDRHGGEVHLPEGVPFAAFCAALHNYAHTGAASPTAVLHNYLAFCALLFARTTEEDGIAGVSAGNGNEEGGGGAAEFRLDPRQFSNVYDVAELRWRSVGGHTRASISSERDEDGRCGRLWAALGAHCYNCVDSQAVRVITFVLCFACGLGYTAIAGVYEMKLPAVVANWSTVHDAFTVAFVTLFTIEVTAKLLAQRNLYLLSPWNVFDASVTYCSLLACVCYACGLAGARPFANLVMLRTLDVFQLLGGRSRFRHIAESMSLLIPRLVSAAIALLLIYYVFAIFAMEFFADAKLLDCCKNTTIEQYYTREGKFYLNNFDNILISYVTLWNLMCVNNWHVIMYAYSYTVGKWSMAFFLLFYITTVIVLTVIVAFIMEAFLFRIQCSRKQPEAGTDSGAYRRRRVAITRAELNLVAQSAGAGLSLSGVFGGSLAASPCDALGELQLLAARYDAEPGAELVVFDGRRRKDRFDYNAEIYAAAL